MGDLDKTRSTSPMVNSLIEAAVSVLNTADTTQKARLTEKYARDWQGGVISQIGTGDQDVEQPPQEPARPDDITLVAPRDAPKRGKGGTLKSRMAMIHSLVHIESVAIDLSWDIIARFPEAELPKEFYDDFVKVAQDEAKHYTMLKERLEMLGGQYGDFEAHSGLWQSALQTADSLINRLVIEHMVHEGRGLDVTPLTIDRLRRNGDEESATLLEEILEDELTHVSAGLKWFAYLFRRDHPDATEEQVIAHFHSVVRKNFRGNLKAPFNDAMRQRAGMSQEWYMPLTQDLPDSGE